MLKRFVDILVSSIALILFSPFMVTIALLVIRGMGRPVLFRHERPGLHRNIFTMYKFRTMRDGRDAGGNLLPDEQRLTSIGKFLRRTSLDELPELFNVFRGDMSLVGPRPLLQEYLNLYSAQQMRRHNVRPGITGWAQINGRNAISWEEKFKLDVWYVENMSFLLDMKIIFMTFFKVFSQEGISQEGHVTMSKFTGSKDYDG